RDLRRPSHRPVARAADRHRHRGERRHGCGGASCGGGALVHRRRGHGRGAGRCGLCSGRRGGGVTLDPYTLAAILGMAAATYLTRIGGWALVRWVAPTGRVKVALEAVPGAVLAAVI